VLSGYLQAARQLEVITGLYSGDGSFSSDKLFTLEEASGVAQHHDAVSGTSKQHVAYDYAFRLAKGFSDAEEVVSQGLGLLAFGRNDCELAQCTQLNVSICEGTTSKSVDQNGGFVVVVYNPLAKIRTEILRIPISQKHLKVIDEHGSDVDFAVISTDISPEADYAQYTLVLVAHDIHPLTTKTYSVIFTHSKKSTPETSPSNKNQTVERTVRSWLLKMKLFH
jgi:alpha-mannosidase